MIRSVYASNDNSSDPRHLAKDFLDKDILAEVAHIGLGRESFAEVYLGTNSPETAVGHCTLACNHSLSLDKNSLAVEAGLALTGNLVSSVAEVGSLDVAHIPDHRVADSSGSGSGSYFLVD